MKGRCCRAILFLAALLLISVFGYSKNAGNSTKSTARQGKAMSQPALQLLSGSIYRTRAGDSLYKIARIYKTTPEALMYVNGLKNSKLKIGQELRIPARPSGAAKDRAPKTLEAAADSNDLFISSADFQAGEPQKSVDESDEPMRLRLVKAGSQMIGVRYRPSGGSEKSGFDCSGLVKNLFSKFNIDLPRTSREQFKQGEKIDRDKLEAGDLVFFSSGGNLPTHVGIYIGDNKFLHAARKAQQVIVSDLNKFWYAMRYLGARRVMDLWWEEPSSASETE